MRGCERKIIMLKGTGSEIFDEAYFLLRRDFKARGGSDEIVREAQRIVEHNTTGQRSKPCRREMLQFSLGMLLGAALCLAVLIIF